jgi:putative tricarboxylic transport membrane protein
MKRAWQIACLAFVAASLTMMGLSFAYPYHDRLGPGPGFFPFWMSLITAGLSLALFVQTTWGASLADAAVTLRPTRDGEVRILFIMGALLVCLVLLDPLGFRLSLFPFLLFLPFALGMRSWWIILIFAALGSFGIFHVFYYWLKVPLPIGVFGI